MNKTIRLGVLLALMTIGSPAWAFMEEGQDSFPGDSAYSECKVPGDLDNAQSTGCNPWPNSDAAYSYLAPNDQMKSSMHYNMTAALAIGAGYTRCAAYALALFDEGTDVATILDQIAWTPFLSGVDHDTCGDLFKEWGIVEDNGLDSEGERTVAGALVAPEFTFRAGDPVDETPETFRESYTFHWNSSFNSLDSPYSVQCSTDEEDPLPHQPDKDMATLADLLSWASTDTNPLNACLSYHDPLKPDDFGPIVRYDGASNVIKPGSIGAFGVFLHALQDNYSHRPILKINLYDHTFTEGATSEVSGFVSSHLAGEFGKMPDTGEPGYGLVTVVTPASSEGYPVTMHSQDTVDAAMATYDYLKLWLDGHPEYRRDDGRACETSVIHHLAVDFASIPNSVQAEVAPSGAKRRSDLADQFFTDADCRYGVIGGDDDTPGDDDATAGDDDSTAGDDDATGGDDVAGDDDATAGDGTDDDDATAGESSGDDDPTPVDRPSETDDETGPGCGCATAGSGAHVPPGLSGAAVLGLGLGLLVSRRRSRGL